MNRDAEILRLRTALRDIVALSIIPAAWVGREPPEIAARLADVLVGSLYLDFAFVRLCDPNGGGAVEVTRGDTWEAFPEWLERHLAVGRHFSRKEIIQNVGKGPELCRGIVIPVGVNAEGGVVAAACDRADFPTEIDQLLLSTVANHAATAFQNSRLIHERRRAEHALRDSEQELRQARNELEIKVAERTAELRRSEAYLREAQRIAQVGYWERDLETDRITWSDQTYLIFGLPLQERAIDFAAVQELTHPEDQQMVAQAVSEALRGDARYEMEYRVVQPGGEVRIVHSQGDVTRDQLGRPRRMFGTIQDITERRRAEDELRASERNLRLLIEAIPGMICRASAIGKIEYVNQRVLDYTGKTLKEIAGFGWARVLHPDDAERVLSTYLQSIATGQTHEVEYRLRRWDGTYRWFQSRADPLRDSEGRVINWYGLLYDIEDRKNAEAILRKTEVELAHATRVMTMGELVASIAHEVNQPLGAIVTNGHACVRLLSREVPDLERSLEVIGRMIKDGIRASEVIKRIRELMHKSPVEMAPLNINETIQEVVALVSSDVLRNKIELNAELQADLPPVLGDRIQLQQVVLNLILNAKDAMSDDQMHPRDLQITTRKTGSDGILVAVRDTGHGLNANDVERIFEPFFTTKSEGMGLGLSISRRIIETHGGTLWATQNEDKGATIQFGLPSNSENES
ncbi:MAG TPA: PAS domain-containing protein [Nitrospiraceae bacterium]|nr:PAS domain-containing protein [Nitrospiraceae bacterium]